MRVGRQDGTVNSSLYSLETRIRTELWIPELHPSTAVWNEGGNPSSHKPPLVNTPARDVRTHKSE